MKDIRLVHPVQWGSLSTRGCQILHRTDICDYMFCATCWLQHAAGIFKHQAKRDELKALKTGLELLMSETISGCTETPAITVSEKTLGFQCGSQQI